MRCLVCSRSDPASVNIRDRLLELGCWEDSGRTFRDAPIHARAEAILIEIEGPSVHDERLEDDLSHLGLPLMDVWFLSKHRAASGRPSLTVHPIGNPGAAEVGGQPRALSPAAGRDMGALLRRIRHHRDEAGLEHDVTYEATHHGPLMRTPSLFVEIGSDESWYEDPTSGQVLAAAIEDVLGGHGRIDGPCLLGVGGGHYVPRMTDRALAGAADFGHLVPAYAIAAEDPDTATVFEMLDRAWAATPGVEGVHVHKKGLKGPQRQVVKAWLGARGHPAWPA